MVFNMLAVLSQFEREQIGERTKMAMHHLRTQGRRISGRVPYGFALHSDGETLVSLPDEQKAIRLMQTLRSQGRSLRAIVSHLENKGIRPKTGRAWTPATVLGILRRSAKLTA
jgi:site-specific DNA recombinase